MAGPRSLQRVGAVSAFDVVPKGIGKIGAKLVGHAAGGALNFFHQALEVIARARDGGDGESRRLPHDGFVQLRYRDVEALPQLVFERANNLTPVFERLGVLDANFEGQLRNRHTGKELNTDSVRRRRLKGEGFFLSEEWLRTVNPRTLPTARQTA